MTNVLGALFEIPSYTAIPLCGDRIGRTHLWALLLGATAGALLCISAFPAQVLGSSTVFLLALAARLLVAAASAMPYVSTPELYPTSSRSTALALVTACGRVGTLVSPTIAAGLTPRALALAVGIGTAVGSVCALHLPETLGKPMAERVQCSAELLHESAGQAGCAHPIYPDQSCRSGSQNPV